MLGSVLRQLLGRPAAARAGGAQAPGADAVGVALALARRGERDAATARLDELLKAHGEDAAALCAMGDVCFDARELEPAERWFRRALLARPAHAPAHAGLGLCLLDRGELDAAHQAFSLACKFAPDDADAWTHLGLVQLRLGILSKADQSLKKALDLAPRHAHAWNNLGNVERARGRPREALQCFKNAVEAAPDLAVAHSNYGTALREAEDREAAGHHLREALRLRPQSVVARHNLGVLLLDEGRFEEARIELQRVLEARPEEPDTLIALGSLHHRLGDADEACRHYERALAVDPELPEARAGLGELQLWLGDFARGWRNYEYRLRGRSSPARPFASPRWQGEDLAGRTLLVYAEQGLGDVVMLSSCLPDVIERAGSVLVLAEERLVGLLARSFPAARVRSFERMATPEVAAEIAAADFHAPMGSLPLHFRNARADFPQRGAYLVAAPERVARARGRLAELEGKLRVGLVWRGGLFKTGQAFRSFGLDAFGPVLRTPGVRFVCLQHGDVGPELALLEQGQGLRITHWQDAANDVEDTVATIAALDLVISVCGSVVHLAGALDQPVWVMVPKASGWRYLQRGDRMPWYRSARLFRQENHDDWSGVVAAVAGELGALAAHGTA